MTRLLLFALIALIAGAGTAIYGQDRPFEPLATFDFERSPRVAFSRDQEQIIVGTGGRGPGTRERGAHIRSWRIKDHEKLLDFKVDDATPEGLSKYGDLYAFQVGGRLHVMRVQDNVEVAGWDLKELMISAGVKVREVPDYYGLQLDFAEDDSAVFVRIGSPAKLMRIELRNQNQDDLRAGKGIQLGLEGIHNMTVGHGGLLVGVKEFNVRRAMSADIRSDLGTRRA